MPNQTHRSKTYQFLTEHVGQFFTPADIAGKTGQKEHNVRIHISDLLKRQRITRQEKVKYGLPLPSLITEKFPEGENSM